MRVKWDCFKSAGIDFIGSITDLDGIPEGQEWNYKELVPEGWKFGFIVKHYPPGQDNFLLVQRDIYVWGNDVQKLWNYVDKNWAVVLWLPDSTKVYRNRTTISQEPRIKILQNDSKNRVFAGLCTIPQHNKGWDLIV